MSKYFKHLDTITALFIAVLLISNVVSTKIVDLGPFTFDAGTILFPLSYIFGDILTEVYGYKNSKKIIWLGFISAFLMSVIFILVGWLKPAADWQFQEDYMNILGLTPRIVAASLCAYFAGSFLNSATLAKIKILTKGKFLWIRTIGSTIIGELADTLLFILIAFTGVLPYPLIISLIISNYVFKTGVEIIFTPLTYKLVNFLKKAENVDAFDTNTNFNPFASN
jgi:uncharacterized integral membrane protein (TIGR00697 family)